MKWKSERTSDPVCMGEMLWSFCTVLLFFCSLGESLCWMPLVQHYQTDYSVHREFLSPSEIINKKHQKLSRVSTGLNCYIQPKHCEPFGYFNFYKVNIFSLFSPCALLTLKLLNRHQIQPKQKEENVMKHDWVTQEQWSEKPRLDCVTILSSVLNPLGRKCPFQM